MPEIFFAWSLRISESIVVGDGRGLRTTFLFFHTNGCEERKLCRLVCMMALVTAGNSNKPYYAIFFSERKVSQKVKEEEVGLAAGSVFIFPVQLGENRKTFLYCPRRYDQYWSGEGRSHCFLPVP